MSSPGGFFLVLFGAGWSLARRHISYSVAERHTTSNPEWQDTIGRSAPFLVTVTGFSVANTAG
jgi:hypothetical protein